MAEYKDRVQSTELLFTIKVKKMSETYFTAVSQPFEIKFRCKQTTPTFTLTPVVESNPVTMTEGESLDIQLALTATPDLKCWSFESI